MRRPSPRRKAFSRLPMFGDIFGTGYRLQGVDLDLPEVAVDPPPADDRVALYEAFQCRDEPERAPAVDHERALVAAHRDLELLPVHAWELRDLDSACSDRP